MAAPRNEAEKSALEKVSRKLKKKSNSSGRISINEVKILVSSDYEIRGVK